LFVIDGAKALRAAIPEVFGAEQAMQRCRTHKIRNVLEELPAEQHVQVSDARRLQAGTRRRRDRQDGKDGPVAGAGISVGGCQLAGRIGGDVHDQPSWLATEFASLSGDDESDQEPTVGCAETHREP
jgi:hypothetical protein